MFIDPWTLAPVRVSTIGDKKKKMLLDHLGAYFLSIGKGGASIFLIKFLMPLKI